MKNTLTATAEELATNFQVTELEPRLENAWSGGRDHSEEHAEPTCVTNGTCPP